MQLRRKTWGCHNIDARILFTHHTHTSKQFVPFYKCRRSRQPSRKWYFGLDKDGTLEDRAQPSDRPMTYGAFESKFWNCEISRSLISMDVSGKVAMKNRQHWQLRSRLHASFHRYQNNIAGYAWLPQNARTLLCSESLPGWRRQEFKGVRCLQSLSPKFFTVFMDSRFVCFRALTVTRCAQVSRVLSFDTFTVLRFHWFYRFHSFHGFHGFKFLRSSWFCKFHCFTAGTQGAHIDVRWR